MKVIDFLVKKIGWGGIIAIILFILIYAYMSIKVHNRTSNSAYVNGISLGVQKGVKGSYYLHYSFNVDNNSYEGNVTTDFCKVCPKCAIVGDTVIVRYENGNPQNNDLVVKIPE